MKFRQTSRLHVRSGSFNAFDLPGQSTVVGRESGLRKLHGYSRTIRGFTLLEVMFAVSIFAFIGLGAYQLLSTIIDTQARVGASNETITRLSRVFNVIEGDLLQVVQRGIRDEYGDRMPPLMVGDGTSTFGFSQIEDIGTPILEFTRTGWNNPMQFPRSDMQRVAYRLQDDDEQKRILQRIFWLVLDRVPESDPVIQTLLNDVVDFRVYVLDYDGEQHSLWPAHDTTGITPRALEIFLETKTLGEIRRIYVLPDVPVRDLGVSEKVKEGDFVKEPEEEPEEEAT
ncbi:MAG: type II secretion system minor pseudopilin GspJ [Gammaproteobacteria bacterium]|nr:type II secretion system minor pseudopilin GspJ [Gammaproteobacteria bacterium]